MGTVIAMTKSVWCVERKMRGESKLGQIPLCHRQEVWNTSTAGECCLNCLLTNMDGYQMNETQCKAREGLGLGMMITQLTWKRANSTARNYCLKYCRPNSYSHPLVPSDKGTRISAVWWWLCGHRVYIALPRNWTGRCALVEPVSEHNNNSWRSTKIEQNEERVG